MNELEDGVHKAYSLISYKLQKWMHDLIEMLPNFIVAILMLAVFMITARTITRVTITLLGRISSNFAINRLIGSSIYFTILLVGIFVALGVLNLDKTVTSLLAGAGIIGLVLGFAFQDIAANFMSGILIAVKKPFFPGDFIQSGQTIGTVDSMNLYNSIIRTEQGQFVVIPNKQLFQNAITNYSTYGKRRIDIVINVRFTENLNKVESTVKEAIQKIEYLDKTREIEFFYKEYGTSSISFEARYWIVFTNKQTDFLRAQSDGIRNIQEAFKEQGIVVPFPIQTVFLNQNGAQIPALKQ